MNTAYREEEEKKAQHGRNRCGKGFVVLVALLIVFMAVAIVMMALYFSRDSQDENVEKSGNGEETVYIVLLFSVVLKEALETMEGRV